MTIAKEAASALPGPNEDRKGIERKDFITNENLAAIG